MDQTAKGLSSRCRRRKGEAGTRALKRVVKDHRHPSRNTLLDNQPQPYRYSEVLHGPSCRTVTVRRLARKQLRRLEPWTEEELNHSDVAPVLSRADFDGAEFDDPGSDFWQHVHDHEATTDAPADLEPPDGLDFDFCDASFDGTNVEHLPPPSPTAVPHGATSATDQAANDLRALEALFGRARKRRTQASNKSNKRARGHATADDPDIRELAGLLEQRALEQATSSTDAVEPEGEPDLFADYEEATTHAVGAQPPPPLTQAQRTRTAQNKATAFAKLELDLSPPAPGGLPPPRTSGSQTYHLKQSD